MRVLGLVPARGGSKGIPRKNIQLLCGKPLLQYTAEAALGAQRLSKTILSTEDQEIAEIGEKCGLQVPFLRPPELAEDATPMLPVVQHALYWLGRHHEYFDAVCLLQPTNPLRQAEDIDGCIELLKTSGADAAITILPVPDKYNPHWVYFSSEDGRLRLSTGEVTPITRRQELPPAYHREGSVYVTRTKVITDSHSLYGERVVGFPLEPERTVNIDDPADWLQAEALIAKGKRD